MRFNSNYSLRFFFFSHTVVSFQTDGEDLA